MGRDVKRYQRVDVERKPWPPRAMIRETLDVPTSPEAVTTADTKPDESLMIIDGSWLFPHPDRFA